MSFDVFISYPHENKTTADAVCAALEANRIRCWIAPRDVDPGTEWAGAIIAAIDRCRVMVVVFSSETNKSKQIRREVQRAFDNGVPIIPFRIEDVRPEHSLAYIMGPVHWLDAVSPPLEQHLERLTKSIKSFLDVELSQDAALRQDAANLAVGNSFVGERFAAKPVNNAIGLGSRRWVLGFCGAAIIAACGATWAFFSLRPPSVLSYRCNDDLSGSPLAMTINVYLSDNTVSTLFDTGANQLQRVPAKITDRFIYWHLVRDHPVDERFDRETGQLMWSNDGGLNWLSNGSCHRT